MMTAFYIYYYTFKLIKIIYKNIYKNRFRVAKRKI